MKTHLNSPLKARHLLSLALVSSLLLPLPSLALPPLAAPGPLVTSPLANSTTTAVLPNLMFVLDDSGSMGWNYVPDYVNGATTILFNNNGYNGMYYNPAIKYTPPAFFDSGGLNTTAYPSQTAANTGNWTAVKDDAYGVITTSTSNLVNNASFYTFVAGEYCTAPDLKTCVTAAAPTATYPFPGAMRWCNSSALTTCKAVRTMTGTYTFPRYPVQSKATINVITSTGNSVGVTGITVSGQQIMSGSISGSTSTTTIASNIATAINDCTMALTGNCTMVGYSASSSGGVVTILAPAPTTATPVVSLSPSTRSRATINITGQNSSPQITGITVGGLQIMSGATSGSSNNLNTIAGEIVTAINNCTGGLSGNCTVAGYSASRSNSTITVIASISTSATPVIAVTSGTLSTSISAFVPDSVTDSVTAFAPGNAIPGTELFTTITSSVTSYPFPGTAAKALERTDCAGTVCTYAEEMTNYANWWAYYQTRIQSMKTSASIAFKPIDSRYRVGYNTISYTGATNGTKFLEINTFDTAQKASWYSKFFAAAVGNSTPLRSAISKVGRLFAHKISGAADPMQYSCQQNFMLMTTDGYWNLGNETSTYGPFDLSGTSWVGDMDSSSSQRSAGIYEGPTASSASLADLARYYYITDLRTSTLNNCTGALGLDVCTNNVFISGTDNNTRQHMTTFTLGLGVNGVLQYQADYQTAQSGDFYNLKNAIGSPTVNWPDPDTTNTSSTVESRIDDLWHAAVNGQGQYFSAKDPRELAAGLSAALQAIGSKVGAGAAAATSTLNPVAGDNSAYVASYTSVQWTGNLESRSINTITGAVSQDATWCAEDVVSGSCPAPGTVVATTVGSSTTYSCNTPVAVPTDCAAPGVLVGGTSCQIQMPTSCTGTMRPRVAGATDGRTIYTKVGTGLGAFTYATLTGAQQTNFNSAFLAANLSQWSSLSTVQQTAAAGTNLVNFLRGQNGFEMRDPNLPIDQLYRSRSAVLGDPLESKPAFIGKPTFSYLDPGYSAFKTANAGRAGTVYIGTNDGMLHAFDSNTGIERWAYVPSMVIPNMWRLADTNYSNMHTNYVNGDSIISDVCSANCTNAATAIWKTILIAGLNGGGKGYFALDITVPNTPILLWEFDVTNDDDLGYTFGNPVVTKKADGTWVVLFTSGYNNTTGTNPGKGFLYVVNALTGSVISKIGTGAGSAAAPSGLAKINAFAPDTEHDNTATFTYGGDLSGNVWRFDINAGTSPLLFATLFDPSGNPQPVTTRPELGLVNGKRVVFVGTGKYLETSDLNNTQQQTLYAMKDDDATTTLVNPRAPGNLLMQQTIASTTSATRKINSPQAVNWSTGNGWYVNFPDGATASPTPTPSERQNVSSQLVAGTLLVPTTVPSNTVCSPGGYGWLNFFDYKTGGPVTTSGTGANVVSAKTNAPIVGINVLFVPDTSAGAAAGQEKPVVSVVTSDQPTPALVPSVPFNLITSSFQQKRVIWRELTQ